ncbi:MAG TPA: fatty acid desaturase, partial [Nannocystis sp.]
FYALYLLFVAGVLPGWAFGALGVPVFLRYFNRWHEALHADQRGAKWHPARDLLILVSPIYGGRAALEELHMVHHREEDGPGDPDRLLMQRRWWRALAWCLLQPEVYTVWQLRHRGLSRSQAARMAVHALVWIALMWLGGWRGLVAYNVVVRTANALAWFVFAWVVHQPWFYGQVNPPALPRALRWLWIALVGRENYYGVRYHFLHHLFPAVPDRYLPELAGRLSSTPTGESA